MTTMSKLKYLEKRKREEGVVVSAKYNAFRAKLQRKTRQNAKILDAELSKRKRFPVKSIDLFLNYKKKCILYLYVVVLVAISH